MTKERTHKIIGVRVPEATAAELELLAQAEQRSVSQIIRFALEEYLNKHFEKKD